jgi:hypothetical protein
MLRRHEVVVLELNETLAAEAMTVIRIRTGPHHPSLDPESGIARRRLRPEKRGGRLGEASTSYTLS